MPRGKFAYRPPGGKNTIKSVLDRLDMPTLDDCWIWQGGVPSHGYGEISWKGKLKLVHRLMYELVHRETLPVEVHICHSCDTPLCCNPSHLFKGNPKINAHDAMNKRRHAHGDIHGKAVLTSDFVAWMRLLFRPGVSIMSDYARAAVLPVGGIRGAITGRTWKHLNEKFPPPVFSRVGTGTGSHYRKLTDSQIREIRSAHRIGESGSSLARRHNVSPSTIKDILKQRLYKAVL